MTNVGVWARITCLPWVLRPTRYCTRRQEPRRTASSLMIGNPGRTSDVRDITHLAPQSGFESLDLLVISRLAAMSCERLPVIA